MEAGQQQSMQQSTERSRQTCALVVARPGQLRDGLQTLLKAVPQIAVVCQAHDTGSLGALPIEPCPALVLLDFDLPPSEAVAALRQIKARWPHLRAIALVDNAQEHQIATDTGADVVLLKGVRATRLLAIIEGMFSPETC